MIIKITTTIIAPFLFHYNFSEFFLPPFHISIGITPLYTITAMRRIKTFRSTTDRIYDGDPIIIVFLPLQPTVVVFPHPGSGL
jgi:hypothetical protein